MLSLVSRWPSARTHKIKDTEKLQSLPLFFGPFRDVCFSVSLSTQVGMDEEGPLFDALYSDRCSAVIEGQNEYRIWVQAGIYICIYICIYIYV